MKNFNFQWFGKYCAIKSIILNLSILFFFFFSHVDFEESSSGMDAFKVRDWIKAKRKFV